MTLQKSGNLTVPANSQQVTRPRARRAKTERFSTVQSDRFIILIAVFEHALFQFEDDVIAATEWMSAPARGLSSKRPMEMLSTRVETDCPACGHYRVSDALVLTLMEQGQIFDVSKTRIWLASKRKEEAIPTIEIHEALLVL